MDRGAWWAKQQQQQQQHTVVPYHGPAFTLDVRSVIHSCNIFFSIWGFGDFILGPQGAEKTGEKESLCS